MKNVMTKILVGAVAVVAVTAAVNGAEARPRHSQKGIQNNVYGDNNIYNYNSYEINRRYVIHDYSNCVKEYYTKLSEKTRVAGQCTVTQPLRLAWTTQNYPYLRENPRRVQFWEGQVSKELEIVVRYKRELVDRCRGKILSQSVETEVYSDLKSYNVVNPNLDPSITESFMLVPMTEQEAQQELSEAMFRCQR